MFLAIITLLTALSMATVAAVFAIYGIIAIFAGMPQFALIMGAVVELGKVVGISWLYRNWNEPTKIKYAMTPLVLVAMMLTSMGIFGLLSKAHLEQTSPVANNEIQIERLDQQIFREQRAITDSETVIAQLDQTVQTLINFDRIRGADGALAVRESQAEQRELLRQAVTTAQTEMDRLEDQKLELTQQLKAIELEVGPVKYLAELVYGDGADRTEEAVRWVIIAFIFVFDPMAILLLMAANYTLASRKKDKEATKELPKETLISETINESTPHTSVIEPTQTEKPEPEQQSDQPEPEQQSEPAQQQPELTDAATVQQEGTTDTMVPESNTPSAVDDAAQAIADSFANQKKEPTNETSLQDKVIDTENVTPVHDVGGGYVEYDNHLFQKDALKELKPNLFAIHADSATPTSTSFGTKFPNIAKKKDIFVRVDVLPHRVYRFNGSKWMEINKSLSETYLYDQEYVRYLVDKISKGEYDVDLLSDQERIQIEEYLSQNS
jgi:multisubunit Na+/H+ antiporter MnhG subunit